MPELAIIIVNYNTRDLLRSCLTDVKRHVATVDATVTVVDNGSSDGSVEMTRNEFPGVSLIAREDNLGFARANNRALEATDSDFVLLLNSDAFLCDGALEELRRVMNSDGQIAAVGPRMFDRNGALLASAHRFETLAKLAATALGLHELLPSCLARSATYLCGRAGKLHRLNCDATAPVDVDWISGACMMVRRSAIAEVGPMDERYFMYMEDEDWCRRFKRAGYTVMYAPAARAIHHVASSSESSWRTAAAYRDSRRIYHRQYNRRFFWLFSALSEIYAARRCASSEWAHLLRLPAGFGTSVPVPGEIDP